jgi:integrase
MPDPEIVRCLYDLGSKAPTATVNQLGSGTALDESNVREAFNRLLDAAGLRRRGSHQMRHTFASLLLAAGEPITYVSRQLGHRDASITLRVYAHWLPDTSARKGVDRLDETQPSATPRNQRR